MVSRERANLPPYKEATQVAKWENGRTPEDGEPDDIVTVTRWIENSEVVTDPDRIDQLEALLVQQQQEDLSNAAHEYGN